MKVLFVFIPLIWLCCSAKAQVIRIYWYQQPVEGGTQQVRNIPAAAVGKEQSEPAFNGRFYLFAEVKKSCRVLFEELFIRGRAYSFTVDSIKKLPFILESWNGGEMILKDTLVRSSENIIVQLKDLALVNNKAISLHLSKKISKTNVVIGYKLNKKNRIANSSKVVCLKPLFTQ